MTVDIKRKTDAATECTKYRQTIYAKPLKDYSLSLRKKASQKSGLHVINDDNSEIYKAIFHKLHRSWIEDKHNIGSC